MHSLHLLFTLSPGNVESLVLLLDAGDLPLHFLDPLVVGLLLTLVIL